MADRSRGRSFARTTLIKGFASVTLTSSIEDNRSSYTWLGMRFISGDTELLDFSVLFLQELVYFFPCVLHVPNIVYPSNFLCKRNISSPPAEKNKVGSPAKGIMAMAHPLFGIKWVRYERFA